MKSTPQSNLSSINTILLIRKNDIDLDLGLYILRLFMLKYVIINSSFIGENSGYFTTNFGDLMKSSWGRKIQPIRWKDLIEINQEFLQSLY